MKKKKWNRRRIAAVIGIVLLLLLYVSDLVLALLGTEEARDLLKVTLTCSIALPILLYGLLVALQKTSWFSHRPEDELTPEQREEARRLMEAAEEEEASRRRAAKK